MEHEKESRPAVLTRQMLKISRMPSGNPEIFHSIQGEGPTVGTPCVFLRLATCNLSCSWCDTRYTWDWSYYDADQEVLLLSAKEIEIRVDEFNCQHLVITGGEPMLQQRGLFPLVSSLVDRGYYCEIETNGTIAPRDGMVESVSQWNVSPKINNSGNRRQIREVPKVLESFRELDNAYFKFVVVHPTDVEEIRRFVSTYDIVAERVVLMPEGVTPGTLQRRGEWVAEACVEYGFRFSSRLHVQLWGAMRGR